MPFQSGPIATTNMAQGVPGALAYDCPRLVFPYTLVSTPELNLVGSTAFTVTSEGVAAAGGAGIFAGILVNPKVYAKYNLTGGVDALAPTMQLPDGTIGELAIKGVYYVTLVGAGAIGDLIIYNTTTGILDRMTPGGSLPGTDTLVPNARIILRASAANGLAIIELNN